MLDSDKVLEIVEKARTHITTSNGLDVKLGITETCCCRTLLRHCPENIEEFPIFIEKHVNTVSWIRNMQLTDNWPDLLLERLICCKANMN